MATGTLFWTSGCVQQDHSKECSSTHTQPAVTYCALWLLSPDPTAPAAAADPMPSWSMRQGSTLVLALLALLVCSTSAKSGNGRKG